MGLWSNIALTYELVDVSHEHFGKAVDRLRSDGFDGFNITSPYKTKFVTIVDKLTPVAARIGAVNTVYRDDDGAWIGDNTDVFGISFCLGERRYHQTCVVGAGGVARAAVEAVRAEHRGEVTLINRSPDSAQRLVEELPDAVDRVRPWSELASALQGADLVINTVPVEALTEMVDWTDGPELHSSSWLELSYGSEAKRWGERLAAHGWKTIDGRRVLVHQGRASFEAWTGVSIPAQVAENAIDL